MNIETLFTTHGEKFVYEPDSHFYCEDENAVWWVNSGEADLFLESNERLINYPFMCVEKNNIFLGGKIAASYRLRAKYSYHAQVYKLDLSKIKELSAGHAKEFATLLDKWITFVYKEFITSNPFNKFYGGTVDLETQHKADDKATVAKGIKWVKITSGNAFLLNDSGFMLSADSPMVPLHDVGWLTASTDITLSSQDTVHALSSNDYIHGLQSIFQYITECATLIIDNKELAKHIELSDKLRHDINYFEHAVSELSLSFSYQETAEISHLNVKTHVVDLLRVVFKRMNLEFKLPRELDERTNTFEKFKAICGASKVFFRNVTLDGEWLHYEHGIIIAINKSDRLVALLYSGGTHKQIDPNSGKLKPISKEELDNLNTTAYCLVKHLPNDKNLRLMDLTKISISEDKKSIVMIFCVFFLTGLLGLLTPIFTKLIFDEIIPYGQYNLFYTIVIVLFLLVFVTSFIQMSSRFIMMRVTTRMSYLGESALYDRLLKLPAKFYSQYSTGDLQDRVNGIKQLRGALTGATISTILSSVFSITSLMLMFAYQPFLALIAMLIVAVSAIISFILGRRNLVYIKQAAEKQGKLAGVLTELITGVSIIKSRGAEARAFYHWSMLYSDLSRTNFKAFILGIVISTITGVVTLISTVVIFASVFILNLTESPLTAGEFMAFNTAFGQFSGGVLGLVNTLVSLLNLVPVYQRAKPILEAIPEANENLIMPERLQGKIEVSKVSFRYSEQDNNVLKDVNLTVEPGQFVAIVGASGGGKSTLLRLILGFEKPTEGHIYYDNVDSEQLDITGYRSNMGVVLQNDALSPQSIYENITSNIKLEADDVWELLETVNLAEEVQEMPMQLNTVVGHSGGGLSGGQKQRVMIARALANKPKLLVLDEATSALDNHTQSKIIKLLEKLKVTRIVVAHRLSTVQNADVIYVLKDGSIVEFGSYDDLINKKGYFHDLVKRQVI